MSELYYPDWQIRRILRDVNTVAMVGASTNWNRPSYFAMKYMQDKGFRVIPVNPRSAGETLLGEEVVASLKDITVPIDMVDISQRPDRVPPVVDQAIEIGAKVRWNQRLKLQWIRACAAVNCNFSKMVVILSVCITPLAIF